MVGFLKNILIQAYNNGGKASFSLALEKTLSILPLYFGEDVSEGYVSNGLVHIKLTEYGKYLIENNFRETLELI